MQKKMSFYNYEIPILSPEQAEKERQIDSKGFQHDIVTGKQIGRAHV